jgi:hypothetical protein
MHHKHDKPTHSSIQDSERRGGDRVQFVVTAEVVEIPSGARFVTRTPDLGPGGCFVDTTVPFPVGTRVQVRLKHGKNTFDTIGDVVYSQTGLGMGISFSELSPGRREELAVWLGDLLGEPVAASGHSADRSHVSKSLGLNRGTDHATVVRLIRLLVGKGILTEAEGASVLHDPVL